MGNHTRRTHGSEFKAKVALEGLKGEQTFAELAQQFQIHPDQIAHWKKELLERAGELFDKGRENKAEPEVKELHAKIGKLTMENDSL